MPPAIPAAPAASGRRGGVRECWADGLLLLLHAPQVHPKLQRPSHGRAAHPASAPPPPLHLQCPASGAHLPRTLGAVLLRLPAQGQCQTSWTSPANHAVASSSPDQRAEVQAWSQCSLACCAIGEEHPVDATAPLLAPSSAARVSWSCTAVAAGCLPRRRGGMPRSYKAKGAGKRGACPAGQQDNTALDGVVGRCAPFYRKFLAQ